MLAADCPAHLDVEDVQAEVKRERPEVLEALAVAAQQDSAVAQEAAPACVTSGSRSEFEVTFLGTGAAVPSKYRNVTGLHLNLFDRGGLLMDCGKAPWAAVADVSRVVLAMSVSQACLRMPFPSLA